VRAADAAQGLEDSIIQIAEGNVAVVRSPALTEEAQAAIITQLEGAYGPATVLAAETVGPSVGAEIAQRAGLAVGLAAIGILGYITYAFRKVEHALRYGVAAILAMLHDVLIVVGFAAIFGHFLGWEVDALFLTALLTVVWFSVHDSIVVFDRIRENVARGAIKTFPEAVNHSLLQTMGRSFNTSLTLIFSILALLLLGGESIRDFLLVLLIGVTTGTYSSVFIASMFLVTWEQGDIPRLWRRLTGRGAAPSSPELAPAE
jgi:preprotein translocase subunit SecF